MPQREPTLRDVAVRTGLSVTTRCSASTIAWRWAYYAAAERGLRIPHDLSIIGFDNQDLIVNGLRPRVTTIELPHYDMGRWAVLELLKLIESGRDRPAPHVALPCPLVRRGSTASAPRGE